MSFDAIIIERGTHATTVIGTYRRRRDAAAAVSAYYNRHPNANKPGAPMTGVRRTPKEA